MKTTLPFPFLAAALAALPAAALTLAGRGRPPAYAIVVPAGAGESCRYAAQELRDHVKTATGTELPVVDDSGDAPPPRAIMLGGTRWTERTAGAAPDLGDEGFRISAHPPHLCIQGGARGVLYGVYELLETYGGAGWFASWHTVVPGLERFEVPDALDCTQRPAFAMRNTSWYDAMHDPAFAARLRLNGPGTIPYGPRGAKYGGVPYRFGGNLNACHTFDKLLPPSKHFKDHPEWYSMVGGVRVGANTQLCLTNPDVLRIVTSNVLECIRKDPDATFYGVSQNDWFRYCTCPECAAVDEEEGGHSGTVIRFVNAVAEAVEREFPGKCIETLAYQYSRRPPKKTRPRRNVVPCLCSIECEFNRPLAEGGYADNESFMADLRGWAALTDNLYIWDYTVNFRDFPFLFPNVRSLGPNLRTFRDNGAKYVYEQGDSMGRHGEFAELKTWLIAKFLWNPDAPAEPLIDRFFAGYYGPAAPFARRYFEEAQALGRAPGVKAWGIYDGERSGNIPDSFLVRATNLWAQAAAAAKGDARFEYNVRMGAMSPLYMIAARGAAAHVATVASDDTAAKDALRLVEEMEACQEASGGKIRWCEGGIRNAMRIAGWEQTKKTAGGGAQARTAFPVARLSTITVSRARRVADPLATDGEAVMFLNTHFDWSFSLPMANIGRDPGATLHLRARVRVDRKPGGEGPALWIGIYDRAARKTTASLTVRAEDAGDGYRWYDVATWKPNDNETLWFAPGRFDAAKHKESPAHNGVYLDALEISRAD